MLLQLNRLQKVLPALVPSPLHRLVCRGDNYTSLAPSSEPRGTWPFAGGFHQATPRSLCNPPR